MPDDRPETFGISRHLHRPTWPHAPGQALAPLNRRDSNQPLQSRIRDWGRFSADYRGLCLLYLPYFLPGITRDSIITLARDKGYELIEERFTRDELYTADEAFFTGTAAELTPIREVDDRQIGAGRRGPVTEDIQNAFFDIIKGKNGRYEKWLAYV